MGEKLPPFEMELYRLVDEVLYYRWDPIGIGDGTWSRDEYHSYLPHTFSLLMAPDGKPQDIADYLYAIATVHMGVSIHTMELDLKIANALFEIKAQMAEKHGLN